MKKVISVFISLLLVLVISGCDISDINSALTDIAADTFNRNIASITELRITPEDKKEYAVFPGQPENKNETIYVSPRVGDTYYKGNTDVTELVRWVSTNENVITVHGKPNTFSTILLRFEIVGEGETEIYAETVDGRLKSEILKFTVDDRYRQNEVATYDTGKYIITRIKYPSKNSTVIDESKDPFFLQYRNRRIYAYKNITDSSYVHVDSVEINGTTAKTKGEIHTFASGGANAVCGFILELKYNEDFTSYTVISEKYDIPELIREKLE